MEKLEAPPGFEPGIDLIFTLHVSHPHGVHMLKKL